MVVIKYYLVIGLGKNEIVFFIKLQNQKFKLNWNQRIKIKLIRILAQNIFYEEASVNQNKGNQPKPNGLHTKDIQY